MGTPKIEQVVAALNESLQKYYAAEGVPGSWSSEMFHRDLERQSELVFRAYQEGDLDKLRVYAAFEPSDRQHSKHQLSQVVESLRAAGYEEVFPMLDRLNLTKAVRMSQTITFERLDNDSGLMNQEGLEQVFDALRVACALGPDDVVDYLVPDVGFHAQGSLRGFILAAERRITDHLDLISTVKLFLESDRTVLDEGLL